MNKTIRILMAAALCFALCLLSAGCGSADASAATQTRLRATETKTAETKTTETRTKTAETKTAKAKASEKPPASEKAGEKTPAKKLTPAEQAAAAEKAAELARMEDSPAFVGKLEQAKDAKQLFVVAGTGGSNAYVSMHQKDGKGKWKQILTTTGYIGKAGLGKKKEGDFKTPVGTYRFTCAFGINDDPGCSAFAYRKVTGDDYWSGDQREGYKYNQMVSIKDLPDLDRKNSERIADYTIQYQYCMNISWNEACVPGKGSAIFLHCTGPVNKFTAGCVALSKEDMITTLRAVDRDCVVVIDTLENLSPEMWKEWDR